MATNFLKKRMSPSAGFFGNNAFTLIEVLLIIAIISILLILSFVAYSSQIEKARDAKSKSNIERIQIALEEYEKDNNCYPAGLPACGVDDPEGDFGNYLSKIPCVPGTDDVSYLYYADPDGAVCRSWYWIFSVLENEDDPQVEDIGCQFGCGPTEALAEEFNYYESSPNAPTPFVGDGTEGPPPPPPPPPSGSSFFGCFSGVCQEIYWSLETGVECSPSYSKTPWGDCNDYGGPEYCLDDDGLPQNECL